MLKCFVIGMILTLGSFRPFVLQGQPVNAVGQSTTPGASTKLTNKDILEIQAAGLSSEVILEKIKASACEFDTTPAALNQLKTAGVSEPVILAMIRCQPQRSVQSPILPSIEPSRGPEIKALSADAVKGYAISYVKSERKWKFGFRSEPFNKISEYFEKQLVDGLEKKGIRNLAVLDSGCCRVTIELLQVTSHPAAIKKPGVDVSGNVSVTDTSNRRLYSKGYQGESRTAMSTWGRLINHAVDNMVKNILEDEDLIRVLANEPETRCETFSRVFARYW